MCGFFCLHCSNDEHVISLVSKLVLNVQDRRKEENQLESDFPFHIPLTSFCYIEMLVVVSLIYSGFRDSCG